MPPDLVPTPVHDGAGMVLLTFLLLTGSVVALVTFISSFAWASSRWLIGLRRLSWRPWSVRSTASVLFFVAVLLMVLVGLDRHIFPHIGLTLKDQPALHVAVPMLVLQFSVVGFIGWLVKRRGKGWTLCFDNPRLSWSRAVLFGVFTWLAVLIPVALSAQLVQWFIKAFGVEPALQPIFALLDPSQGILIISLLIGMIVVGAPIAEELFFRGMLLPALTRHVSPPLAVLISSLIFTVIHLHVPAFVPLFVLSLGLSLLYIYTQSIRACVVTHMIFNSMAMVAWFFGNHAPV